MNIQDLEIGITYYECEAGRNIAFQIAAPPYRVEEQPGKLAGWEVQLKGGGELYAADNSGHYAPRIYAYPEYLEGNQR